MSCRKNEPKFGAVLFAKDVNKIAKFYGQLLCLSITHAEAETVILKSDACLLTIHGIPEDIAETISISIPPQLRENTSIKLFFPVDSLSAARETAYKLGGGLSSLSAEWSTSDFRACDGFDPEGNVVQFREDIL